VHAAWADLLGLAGLGGVHVVDESPMAPPGWVSLIRMDDVLTVLIRDVDVDVDVFDGLVTIDLDVVRERLPFDDHLGPASLFFPSSDVAPGGDVELVGRDALTPLFAACAPDDLDECGLETVESDVSVVRVDGEIAAACGWHTWPASIAHLGVLTHPGHRGHGLARVVATDAAARADAVGLLPQWRARIEASKAVARAIGFVERGAQVRVRPIS